MLLTQAASAVSTPGCSFDSPSKSAVSQRFVVEFVAALPKNERSYSESTCLEY